MQCPECKHEMSLEEEIAHLKSKVVRLERELTEARLKSYLVVPYIPYSPPDSPPVWPTYPTWTYTIDTWTLSDIGCVVKG